MQRIVDRKGKELDFFIKWDTDILDYGRHKMYGRHIEKMTDVKQVPVSRHYPWENDNGLIVVIANVQLVDENNLCRSVTIWNFHFIRANQSTEQDLRLIPRNNP